MLLRRAVFAAWMLLVLAEGGSAQDLLQFFLTGGPSGRLMGGDPFPAPVLQHPAFSSGERGYVRFGGRLDNYYKEERRDGSSPGLHGGIYDLTAMIPLTGRTDILIQTGSQTVLSQALNTADQVATYDNRQKALRVSVGTHIADGIRWNMAAGHTTASGTPLRDLGTGVMIGTGQNSVSLQMDRSASNHHLALSVGGVNGFLPLGHEQITTRIDVRSGGFPSFELSAAHSVLSQGPGNPTDQMRFAPSGIMVWYRVQAFAPVTDRWDAHGSIEHRSMTGHGEFTSDGSGYGALHAMSYRELSVVAAVRRTFSSGSRVVADLRWTSIRGSLDGHLESWPFVSTLESPLATRAMFRIGGSFEVLQAHAGGRFPATSWLELGGGLAAIRLIPDLRVESWQAGFLGLGRKAYTDRRLVVRTLDGAMVSAGFRASFGLVTIEYAVSQFVPVRIRSAVLPSGTGSLVSAPETGAVIRSWGGLFQHFSAQWDL